jgi:NADPH2:quinone reductase
MALKAVVIYAPGAPEQLVMADVPEPSPGPGEVLVDVAFAGCNWADTQIRTGIYPHPFTYPLVLGFEISGTVSKLGPGVSGVKVGDRVATFVEKGGAYAEKAVAPANMLVPLPDAIPFDIGAAIVIQPMTGYHMLHTLHRLEPGETVLINAIGGGVGLFTTQLAVKAGARVVGTVGTPGKEKRALDYGATRVVITTKEDFEQAVLDFTNGRGVDLAIDSLGATMLDRTFNVVRKLGHIISIGEAEGQPFKNIRERILPRSQTFTRFHLGHIDPGSAAWKNGVEHVLGGVRDGWLKVPIAGVFPMSEAAEMHRRIESRQAAGKLLLAIGG